jgi:signal recognition particle subunit SRP68
LIAQARTSLFDPSFPLQEEIISLPESTVADLESQIKALDLAAKRALFAERVAKPVFFDNAFNYIDLPMDELLVKAGREPAKAETPVVASVAESVVQKVEKAAEEVKKSAERGLGNLRPLLRPNRKRNQKDGWAAGLDVARQSACITSIVQSEHCLIV